MIVLNEFFGLIKAADLQPFALQPSVSVDSPKSLLYIFFSELPKKDCVQVMGNLI